MSAGGGVFLTEGVAQDPPSGTVVRRTAIFHELVIARTGSRQETRKPRCSGLCEKRETGFEPATPTLANLPDGCKSLIFHTPRTSLRAKKLGLGHPRAGTPCWDICWGAGTPGLEPDVRTDRQTIALADGLPAIFSSIAADTERGARKEKRLSVALRRRTHLSAKKHLALQILRRRLPVVEPRERESADD